MGIFWLWIIVSQVYSPVHNQQHVNNMKGDIVMCLQLVQNMQVSVVGFCTNPLRGCMLGFSDWLTFVHHMFNESSDSDREGAQVVSFLGFSRK